MGAGKGFANDSVLSVSESYKHHTNTVGDNGRNEPEGRSEFCITPPFSTWHG